MGFAGTPVRDPGSTFRVSPVSTFPHGVDGGNRGNWSNWGNRGNRGDGRNRGDGGNRGDGIRRTRRIGGRYVLREGGGNRGNRGSRGDPRGGIGGGEEGIRFFALWNTISVTWHNQRVGFFAFGGFGVRDGFWNSRKQAEFVVHGGVVVEIGLLVGGQVVVDGVQNLVELVGIDEIVVELAKNQLEIVDVIIMILDVRLQLVYGRLVRVSLVLLLSFRFAFAFFDLAL